jgi:hypothetical protein
MPLVDVKDGGKLVMTGNAKITGNTNSNLNQVAGGVTVWSGGEFVMEGGEISGNTATYAGAVGGVLVSGGGVFTKTWGAITGNTGSGAGAVYWSTTPAKKVNGDLTGPLSTEPGEDGYDNWD